MQFQFSKALKQKFTKHFFYKQLIAFLKKLISGLGGKSDEAKK